MKSPWVFAASIALLGIGASALANIVTRKAEKKRGLLPALAAASAITVAGLLLTGYLQRAEQQEIAVRSA